jgi:hypothetical protein
MKSADFLDKIALFTKFLHGIRARYDEIVLL